MRITRTDVNNAAQNLLNTLKRLEMIPETAAVVTSAGSSTNGLSWSVAYYADPDDRTPHRLPAVDLHGAMRAQEAYDRITAANTALTAVEIHLNGGVLVRMDPDEITPQSLNAAHSFLNGRGPGEFLTHGAIRRVVLAADRAYNIRKRQRLNH